MSDDTREPFTPESQDAVVHTVVFFALQQLDAAHLEIVIAAAQLRLAALNERAARLDKITLVDDEQAHT